MKRGLCDFHVFVVKLQSFCSGRMNSNSAMQHKQTGNNEDEFCNNIPKNLDKILVTGQF
jgi:hypothetical protein